MNVLFRNVVAAALLLTQFLGRASHYRLPGPPGAAAPAASGQEQAVTAPARPPIPGDPPGIAGEWSPAEVSRFLLQQFSRELLRVELDLAAARYRAHYWEPEPGLAELQPVEEMRSEAVRRLTSEMNEMFADLCPGQAGETLRLEPHFSFDRPAPNLAFLSTDSRREMENILMSRGGWADIDELMAAARTILTPDELVTFVRWNEPQAASLRNRLAGFEATEQEFAVILQYHAAAGTDREAGSREVLRRAIGTERLAQLEEMADPVVATAIQDLRRIGLPLSHVPWLVNARSEASRQLQQSWNDSRLSDAEKRQEVEQLKAAFQRDFASILNAAPETTEWLP